MNASADLSDGDLLVVSDEANGQQQGAGAEPVRNPPGGRKPDAGRAAQGQPGGVHACQPERGGRRRRVPLSPDAGQRCLGPERTSQLAVANAALNTGEWARPAASGMRKAMRSPSAWASCGSIPARAGSRGARSPRSSSSTTRLADASTRRCTVSSWGRPCHRRTARAVARGRPAGLYQQGAASSMTAPGIPTARISGPTRRTADNGFYFDSTLRASRRERLHGNGHRRRLHTGQVPGQWGSPTLEAGKTFHVARRLVCRTSVRGVAVPC